MKSIAAIQMASGPNISANLHEVNRLVTLAAKNGAKLCVLPESFVCMGMREKDVLKVKEKADGLGEIQQFLSNLAKKNKVWLVGGTIPLAAKDKNKIRASCLLFDDQGEQVARYDKVHLFDVNLGKDKKNRYRESEMIEPGNKVVVVDTPFGRLGLAVCYDLRFPEFFRCMSEQAVEIITVPSAFTALTGKVHWEVLVRARAIENLSYVIAPNQGGFHVNGRETFGHSMIVDPWGLIQAEHPQGSGVIYADLDLTRLRQLRKNFPSIQHRQFLCQHQAST